MKISECWICGNYFKYLGLAGHRAGHFNRLKKRFEKLGIKKSVYDKDVKLLMGKFFGDEDKIIKEITNQEGEG